MGLTGFISSVTAYLTLPFRLIGYEWNRSSPLRSSPDTASPMYPDRPIRPLPKRRLRDRMSPEQAESIVYPPQPPSTGPLFNFPLSSGDRANRTPRQGEGEHHACHCGHSHSDVESEEEEDERGVPVPSSPSYHYSRNFAGKTVAGAAGAYPKPGSTSSSVDGYESFENTNNKKKRKIPNMGGASTHHTSLSAEMASMGISHAHDTAALDDGDGAGRYHGTAPSTPQHSTSGTGISGAGRGRFGRPASGRSERRVLGNSTNLANAKASSKRTDFRLGDDTVQRGRPCANSSSVGPPDQAGIISTAIANAQATPPHAGNENVSLLQQEASKSSASKTQFTFTCGSDSANKMVWPGQENGSYPQPPGAYPTAATVPPPHAARARPPGRPDAPMVATQGTQTSPSMNGTHTPPAAAAKTTAAAQKGAHPSQQAPPPRKPRRSAAKLYAYAARKRRIQQEYANFHNPPNPAWICEFCEYEDIFGRPPEALIRQYEIKDRKERKRLAEKRRLLEKARMKGRKGKKTGKKQNNANNTQHNQNPPHDRRVDDGPLDDGEYYDDEYDDEPPHAPVPGRACDHPSCPHHHHAKSSVMPPGDPRGSVANGA